MNEVERIIDQLERAYNGDAWCGSSLGETLKGMTAEHAARRPLQNAHSVWEIVMHVSAWLDAVRERMSGEYVRQPADGDWQEVTDASEEAWAETLRKLEARHQALIKSVAALSDEELKERLGTERDRALGAGVSRYVTLHGTVQHYLYHAGQIALLKKAV